MIKAVCVKHWTRLVLAGAALALAGCEREQAPVEPAPVATSEPKSIFRPEFQPEKEEKEVLRPLEATILFPEGVELDETALKALAGILASPQLEAGGAIVLRGHSDAGGSDEVNLRVSRGRAEAVRDWLVESGVAEERITLVAFGEQNPVKPNALPDGTPNEQGRTANRRVEITISLPADKQVGEQAEEPTLAEALAEPEEQPEGESTAPARD